MNWQCSVIIPAQHASYPDHFPGNTIVPGVVLLECVLASCPESWLGGTHIAQCKFLESPAPGSELGVYFEEKGSRLKVIAKLPGGANCLSFSLKSVDDIG